MRNIYIMSGLPASGKSTYANAHAHWGDVVLHRDEFRDHLRAELHSDDYFPCSAAEEYRRWAETIRHHLTRAPGVDVYIDQTTLTQKALDKLVRAIQPALTPNDQLFIVVCHCCKPICMKRNAARESFARVPDKVMESMHDSMRADPIREEACRIHFPDLNFAIHHTTETEG